MTQDLELSLSKLSSKAFKNFGLEDMAYIKPILVDGEKGYSVHAADGTELSIIKEENIAMATLIQNNLDPLLVH